MSAPYTLPLPMTPRQSTAESSGFARRTMGVQPSGRQAAEKQTPAHHAPLSARPPSTGDGAGYKRSAGLLKTLDLGRLGSAGQAHSNTNSQNNNGLPHSTMVVSGVAQTARVPPTNSSSKSVFPTPPITRMPTAPDTARTVRPGTGSLSNGPRLLPVSTSGREPLPSTRMGTLEVSSPDEVYVKAPPVAKLPVDGSMGKMLPSKALELYEAKLTRYERKEILDYDEVFFVGVAAVKIDAPVADAPNYGYDDDKGDYVVVVGDHIAYRYEVIGGLGKGSFGQVLQVKDHKKGTIAALKLIRNKKRFHQQAMIEIKILDHLRCRDPEEKSCTVRMLNYFKFRSHTVITFDVHSINLYELTKLNNYQPFAPALIKRFTAQLLVSLAFMYQEQIVHCDIKPENVLLRYENKTSLKLIDFGSSCFENDRIYTYIQSRFYRAPEIILGIPYGRKIDMWSLGCVICEMQMGFPIFPGESEVEQIQCIMEVMGLPPNRMIEKAPRKSEFFESNGAPKIIPNSRNKIRKPATKDLAKVLRSDDASFVDFVRQFLQWDPADRSTPHDAMHHPWITECFRHAETRPQPPLQSTETPPKEVRRRSSASAASAAAPKPSARQALPLIEKR